MKTRFFLIAAMLLTLMSGCVKDELYKGAPSVTDLAIDPLAPIAGQPVTVIVKVTDLYGIRSVKLSYAVNGGTYTEVEMINSSSNPQLYGRQIPGQDDGAIVTYYVTAINNGGLSSVVPKDAPASPAAYTIGAPLVLINEVYSRGTAEEPDWVELYNASNSEADIGGFKIYDSGGQTGAKPKKEIPAGTKIPANGFFVIVVDDGSESGFGLSSAGEQVWLDNNRGNQIDNVSFPSFEPTQSYGRVPDGGSNWEILNTITKGSANSSLLPTANLFINEIYSQGTTENPDWIEIYNASPYDADLSGWKIYDSGGQSGSKPKKTFTAGSVIPSKGFLVVVVDDASETGFGLSSNGETIWLETPQGTIAKEVSFPALTAIQSYGCYPDGTDNYQIFETITKGAANSNLIPQTARVVINEIFSRGTVEQPDWIELYNDGDASFELTGWKIYDSGGQGGSKPKMEIPAGTNIAAKGFLVITVDDGSTSGFGLSTNGEKVWLEKANGSIADEMEFPMLSETQSFGRYPDGTDNLMVMETITKGAANSNAIPQVAALFMNEIFSRGTIADPDWIEIYNDGNSAVDLTGWKIYDSGGQGGTKPKKEFPTGASVPAKGFYVIVVDDTDPSGFGLASGGEKVWLEKPDGNLANEIEFPALAETQSFGRFPDGSANLQVLETITKGLPNSNAGPNIGAVVMNEAFSRGAGDNPDWIEIYNGTNAEVNLEGYKIYDNGGQTGTKPKKLFPAGAIIPAKGFYVIVVDDTDPSGFGLGSGGDEVWFELPDGTLIDHVLIPALSVTQSYGRQPDGSENWKILETITRGTSNNSAKKLRK